MTERERCHESLVGLAVGDAVGTTLEFRRPGEWTDEKPAGQYPSPDRLIRVEGEKRSQLHLHEN